MSENALVSFLRSYGPSAASDSLCDEHVQEAVARYGVEPIEVPAPAMDIIWHALLGPDPMNVILTGTAGDGKTYHIRRFYMDALKGDPSAWPGEEGIISVRLGTGQELRILRDLSEVSEDLRLLRAAGARARE